MTNTDLAEKVIQSLVDKGVDTFCYSSGSRNAPFIEILSRCKGLKTFDFFDERSMSFFALGRSKRDQRPVAVITTSGTAVFELFPALVESYYSKASLVLVTCDRPAAYKNSGAPQCVKQNQIFTSYVESELDLEVGFNEDINLLNWDIQNSLHMNVRFEEPMLDQKKFNFHFNPVHKIEKNNNLTLSKSEENQLNFFFKKCKKPCVIVSELNLFEKDLVKNFLSKVDCPIYLEPLSQLREEPSLQDQSLKSGSSILSKALKKKMFDGVIRIGGIPVLRFWRDLNNIDTPVLSLSSLPFSGLKNREPALPLESFLKQGDQWLGQMKSSSILDLDQEERKKKKPLDKEQAWIQWLSSNIPKQAHIFLGNSNPIRYWDEFATREDNGFIFSGNRGANGIDGIGSTFFGRALDSRPNYCILGDLSLLYDLSAPWILKQLNNCNMHIVVINNFGGKIFEPMYSHPAYLNAHQIQFKEWAQMWKLYYQCIKQEPDSLKHSGASLVEIQT